MNNESLLKKEFKGKDVQRMRNIITKNYTDKTTTQIGYTKEQVDHKEGDVWEEKTTLIVKTSHRRNNIMDREFTQNRLTALLRSVKADPTKRKCSLKLLHGDMSEAEMKTLYAHPAIKCMVTATHGEGFCPSQCC